MKKNLSNSKMNAGANTLASSGANFMKSKVDFAPDAVDGSFQTNEEQPKLSKKTTGRPDLASSELNGTSSFKMDASANFYRSNLRDSQANTQKQAPKAEGRLDVYDGDEDQLACMRFPHKKYCGCDFKCYESEGKERFRPVQVV